MVQSTGSATGSAVWICHKARSRREAQRRVVTPGLEPGVPLSAERDTDTHTSERRGSATPTIEATGSTSVLVVNSCASSGALAAYSASCSLGSCSLAAQTASLNRAADKLRREMNAGLRRVAAERIWPQSAASEAWAPRADRRRFESRSVSAPRAPRSHRRVEAEHNWMATSGAADGRFLHGSAATHGRHRPRTAAKRGSCDELLGFSGGWSE